MEAARSSETLVSYHIITWLHNTEYYDLDTYPCQNIGMGEFCLTLYVVRKREICILFSNNEE
jgi:hypothetical protein